MQKNNIGIKASCLEESDAVVGKQGRKSRWWKQRMVVCSAPSVNWEKGGLSFSVSVLTVRARKEKARWGGWSDRRKGKTKTKNIYADWAGGNWRLECNFRRRKRRISRPIAREEADAVERNFYQRREIWNAKEEKTCRKRRRSMKMPGKRPGGGRDIFTPYRTDGRKQKNAG